MWYDYLSQSAKKTAMQTDFFMFFDIDQLMQPINLILSRLINMLFKN